MQTVNICQLSSLHYKTLLSPSTLHVISSRPTVAVLVCRSIHRPKETEKESKKRDRDFKSAAEGATAASFATICSRSGIVSRRMTALVRKKKKFYGSKSRERWSATPLSNHDGRRREDRQRGSSGMGRPRAAASILLRCRRRRKRERSCVELKKRNT